MEMVSELILMVAASVIGSSGIVVWYLKSRIERESKIAAARRERQEKAVKSKMLRDDARFAFDEATYRKLLGAQRDREYEEAFSLYAKQQRELRERDIERIADIILSGGGNGKR